MVFNIVPQQSVKIDSTKVTPDDLLKLTLSNGMVIFVEKLEPRFHFLEIPREFWPEGIRRVTLGSQEYRDMCLRDEPDDKWMEHTRVTLHAPSEPELNFGKAVQLHIGYSPHRDGWGAVWDVGARIIAFDSVLRADALTEYAMTGQGFVR